MKITSQAEVRFCSSFQFVLPSFIRCAAFTNVLTLVHNASTSCIRKINYLSERNDVNVRWIVRMNCLVKDCGRLRVVLAAYCAGLIT